MPEEIKDTSTESSQDTGDGITGALSTTLQAQWLDEQQRENDIQTIQKDLTTERLLEESAGKVGGYDDIQDAEDNLLTSYIPPVDESQKISDLNTYLQGLEEKRKRENDVPTAAMILGGIASAIGVGAGLPGIFAGGLLLNAAGQREQNRRTQFYNQKREEAIDVFKTNIQRDVALQSALISGSAAKSAAKIAAEANKFRTITLAKTADLDRQVEQSKIEMMKSQNKIEYDKLQESIRQFDKEFLLKEKEVEAKIKRGEKITPDDKKVETLDNYTSETERTIVNEATGFFTTHSQYNQELLQAAVLIDAGKLTDAGKMIEVITNKVYPKLQKHIQQVPTAAGREVETSKLVPKVVKAFVNDIIQTALEQPDSDIAKRLAEARGFTSIQEEKAKAKAVSPRLEPTPIGKGIMKDEFIQKDTGKYNTTLIKNALAYDPRSYDRDLYEPRDINQNQEAVDNYLFKAMHELFQVSGKFGIPNAIFEEGNTDPEDIKWFGTFLGMDRPGYPQEIIDFTPMTEKDEIKGYGDFEVKNKRGIRPQSKKYFYRGDYYRKLARERDKKYDSFDLFVKKVLEEVKKGNVSPAFMEKFKHVTTITNQAYEEVPE